MLPGCARTEPCLRQEAGARHAPAWMAPEVLHTLGGHTMAFAPPGIRIMSTSTELKDQGEPEIVTRSLASATTKSYFPLRRWQWMYITCIITAAIFTAQKLAQQEFNSIKFHYSEKGNSVLTSENSSHKTCKRLRKDRKGNSRWGGVGGHQAPAGKLSPATPNTSAQESSSLRGCIHPACQCLTCTPPTAR